MNPSEPVSPATAGYGGSAAVAIILNTLLTWAKESYPPLLAAMKAIAHHWVVHGAVIVLSFFILGYIFSERQFARTMSGKKMAVLLTISTIVAGLGLVGFFLAE